jgi:hypothetical protein
VSVCTPVLPALVHDAYREHSDDDSELYEVYTVDVALHALLMQLPTLLPLPSSQYSDCCGHQLVVVLEVAFHAEDRHDCYGSDIPSV